MTAVSTDNYHRYDRRLLFLYHLVTAKVAIALGGVGPRAKAEGATERQTGADA